MTNANPSLHGASLSDPMQAILGHLQLLITQTADLMPLLDLLNQSEGDPIRKLAEMIEVVTKVAAMAETLLVHLPGQMAAMEKQLTAMQHQQVLHHQEQMKYLRLLARQFESVA
ncbi:MAG: hypothetical protein IIX61_06145 [Loktanella sp.]|nr:hypothetical protein [Loktanella sp.]